MARCNAKLCELTHAKFEVGEYFGAHELAMTEKSRYRWHQVQAVVVHEPSVIASTLWISRDAVDQSWTLSVV